MYSFIKDGWEILFKHFHISRVGIFKLFSSPLIVHLFAYKIRCNKFLSEYNVSYIPHTELSIQPDGSNKYLPFMKSLFERLPFNSWNVLASLNSFFTIKNTIGSRYYIKGPRACFFINDFFFNEKLYRQAVFE